MPVGLILESLVAVLLVVTIGYCFILNRRLAALRHGQNDMHNVVRSLNETTDKARISMESLRRNTKSIADELGEKIKSGRAIADELGMIVESGNNIANRLTDARSSRRQPVQNPGPLEALSRLDDNFRRQFERNNAPSPDAAEVKTKSPVKENATDNDLRVALRAMR